MQLVCALPLGLWPTVSRARPVAPELLCGVYPDIAECSGKIVNCTQCHSSVYPVAWNGYGRSVKARLPPDEAFELGLATALRAVEQEDSDADGLANLRELELGTLPGDASSGWSEPAPPAGQENPRYDVGNYDYRFAYRRVSVLYCGQSPSYEELQALQDAELDQAALRQHLHAKLAKTR